MTPRTPLECAPPEAAGWDAPGHDTPPPPAQLPQQCTPPLSPWRQARPHAAPRAAVASREARARGAARRRQCLRTASCARLFILRQLPPPPQAFSNHLRQPAGRKLKRSGSLGARKRLAELRDQTVLLSKLTLQLLRYFRRGAPPAASEPTAQRCPHPTAPQRQPASASAHRLQTRPDSPRALRRASP